jgi:hypothetical protein
VKLKTLAYYLAESGETAREETGLRLAGSWGRPYFLVSLVRAFRGDAKGARAALDAGLKLETDTAQAHYAHGMVCVAEEDWPAVISQMRSCLALGYDYGVVRYELATGLFHVGEFQEARDEYRAYLSGENPEYALEARNAITGLNLALRNQE